jgi:hypothetical protein
VSNTERIFALGHIKGPARIVFTLGIKMKLGWKGLKRAKNAVKYLPQSIPITLVSCLRARAKPTTGQ